MTSLQWSCPACPLSVPRPLSPRAMALQRPCLMLEHSLGPPNAQHFLALGQATSFSELVRDISSLPYLTGSPWSRQDRRWLPLYNQGNQGSENLGFLRGQGTPNRPGFLIPGLACLRCLPTPRHSALPQAAGTTLFLPRDPCGMPTQALCSSAEAGLSVPALCRRGIQQQGPCRC